MNKQSLLKYLRNTSSSEEIKAVENWITSSKQNRDVFNQIKSEFIIDTFDETSEETSIEEAYQDFKGKQVIGEMYILRKIKPLFRYAAVVLIFIATGYFIYSNPVENVPITISNIPTSINSAIEPGNDKATLTMGDGSQIALEKGASFQTQNANSNGEKIVYTDSKQNTDEVVYNYLTVPRGGQFFIKLSDGTQVWLNSESQLKYPVNFIEGKSRKVELVYGEAYFDVSPSSEHNGADFKVYQDKQEIQVLGTEFNIKAYKDENHIYTTLVEGKVVIGTGNKKQHLIPNQQSNFNPDTGTIEVAKVDVYNVISWKEGVFSFEEASLKEIMKVLSRWYDIEIIFENKNIENKEFIGLLRKDQNIEKIISAIKDFGIIKDFEFKDKSLFIR